MQATLRMTYKMALLLMLVLSTGNTLLAQKYLDKAGTVRFFSSAPLEDIEAESKHLSSVIDAAKEELAAVVQMTTFQFDKSLMQEHFNENYIESDKYPKATFKGKLIDFNTLSKEKGVKQTVKVVGEMNLHGVTKPFDTTGEITWLSEKSFKAHAVFNIKLEDYDIEIPTVVFQNIAEVVEVTLDLTYTLQ